MNKYFVILIIILSSTFSGFAQGKQSGGNSVENTPIPFTIGDRDRLNRLEVRMDALEKNLDARFKAIDYRFDVMEKRMDSLQTLIYFALGAIFSMFGFILWDRRSYMKPIKAEQENLKEKLKTYERIFKEISIDNPKYQEIMKMNGLL